MTHEEVMQMLAELKIPFAYDHFAEGEYDGSPVQHLPFLRKLYAVWNLYGWR